MGELNKMKMSSILEISKVPLTETVEIVLGRLILKYRY